MKLSHTAAQLYTCRDSLQDSAGVARTLSRLRKIGYTAVQASGLGPSVTYEELGRILADTGMTCAATHESSDLILSDPRRVVERLNVLGCKITSYPYPGGVDLSSVRAVREFAARLQRACDVLAAAGQVLCYHNHNIEFRKVEGRVILDLIYEHSSIHGELDTYWVQYGGGDNVAWCNRLAGRLATIHLKDYCTRPDNTPAFCEIGQGVLDFKAIIAAAQQAGCRWFIVEQDTCPGDPVDSLEISYRHIAGHLAEA